MDQLLRHDWPGNVRELMNVIERGGVLSHSEFLDTEDLPITPRHRIRNIGESEPIDDIDGGRIDDIGGGMPLKQVEKATILRTLESAGGNKSEAARRLGITRKTLHKKLKRYGAMP